MMENDDNAKGLSDSASDKADECGKADKKVLNKIVSSVVSVFLGIAVILCLFVMSQVLGRGYVSFGGHSVFRVVTGSMEPAIPTGAVLVCDSIDIDKIQVGDIICFRSKDQNMLGRIITHRVVGIVYDDGGAVFLRTMGDANPSEDGYYVTDENLVGKVTWHTGDGSVMATIISFITDKIGFFSIIVVPILLIAAFVLKENVKSIKKELEQAVAELEKEERKSLDAGKASEKEKRAEGDEPDEPPISREDYQEMYDRIKAELLEEMEKGATEEQPAPENEAENTAKNDNSVLQDAGEETVEVRSASEEEFDEEPEGQEESSESSEQSQLSE